MASALCNIHCVHLYEVDGLFETEADRDGNQAVPTKLRITASKVACRRETLLDQRRARQIRHQAYRIGYPIEINKYHETGLTPQLQENLLCSFKLRKMVPLGLNRPVQRPARQ